VQDRRCINKYGTRATRQVHNISNCMDSFNSEVETETAHTQGQGLELHKETGTIYLAGLDCRNDTSLHFTQLRDSL
jgi:hypothetical protein